MEVFAPGLENVRRLLAPDSLIDIFPMRENPEPIPAEKLRGKHILFCHAPPRNFHELDDLRFIQLSTVGYSQLYGLSWPEKGVLVANARGVYDVAIAEWCISMMINLARDLPGMFRNQSRRVWDRDARFQQEIRGTTLGIYGYGGIGRETARLAKALGVRVWVLARGPLKRREGIHRLPGTGDPEAVLADRVFSLEAKYEFFSGLDYLLLAMPHTPKTGSIIGARELAALPRTASVLNPARGPLIEEEALVEALRSRRIRGAALDTHYQYPLPSDHPLWSLDNVILTPHISGASGNRAFLPRIWELFSENVRRFLAGEDLINAVAPAELLGE